MVLFPVVNWMTVPVEIGMCEVERSVYSVAAFLF